MTLNARPRLTALALAALAALSSTAAFADAPKVRVSGFGTIGGTVADGDDVYFRTSSDQQKGATSDLDIGLDSRLALQGVVQLGNDVSVMAQALAMRRGDEDFKPGMEWLYVQYSGLDGLDLRLGRMVLPAFMVSDSRLVGYSLPWARVPALVYSMLPMSSVDGVQANYSKAFGHAIVSLQGTFGSSESASGSEISDIGSVNATLEYGDWTARFGYVKSNVTVSSPVPGLDIPGFKDKFTGLGLQYDNGAWFVTTEYVQRKNPTHVFDSSAAYVGAGIRLGKWTPYAVLSEFKPSEDIEPAFYVPTPIGNVGVRLLDADTKTTGVVLGARYDVASGAALKLEYGRYDGRDPLIFNNTDGSSPLVSTFDKAVNTFTVNLDFVF